MYDDGIGWGKNVQEAFTWYERAAKTGHVDAQFNMGVFYQNGVDVEKNTQQSHWVVSKSC